jgi:hypothetical protein
MSTAELTGDDGTWTSWSCAVTLSAAAVHAVLAAGAAEPWPLVCTGRAPLDKSLIRAVTDERLEPNFITDCSSTWG